MSSYYSIHSKSKASFPYRKSYGLIAFAIIILTMSWESQRIDAAIVSSHIPEEAIRLRILANSDSVADQAVKRLVRDEIVKAMNSWAVGPQSIEEARQTIADHMDEIEAITSQVLESRGFTYDSSAKLGLVAFPTKMYGSELYPAGDYEALLITLGAGEGQNWWCVLFPPLCFIDAATGEASAASADIEQSEVKAQAADAKPVQSSEQKANGDAPEAKFFIVEMFQKLISWIKSLFN